MGGLKGSPILLLLFRRIGEEEMPEDIEFQGSKEEVRF